MATLGADSKGAEKDGISGVGPWDDLLSGGADGTTIWKQ